MKDQVAARIGPGLGVSLVIFAVVMAGLPLYSPPRVVRAGQRGQTGTPMTGPVVPALASFDRIVPAFMKKWQIPGGAIAVMKDGRLVMARGYGWADLEARRPVEPGALFRIASMSKSLTAAAILKLVEERRLRLDEKAFLLLNNLKPAPGAHVDRRIYDITIRELMQHSAGWDRDKSFDPMFMSKEIAAAMGVAAPAGPETIIRF
ncbi:MAG TPA: serine hydrolase domain-containing protein, partial [Blastocatellia bacterium]|nr:serine hydrolase domain-containing protein [Blastocatellia bacterium]